MVKKYLSALLGLTLLLGGCSGVDIESYRSSRPVFDLLTYFAGETRGWGIVRDWKGEVKRQFTVDIAGEITAPGTIVLKEDFYWSDGEQTRRTWRISKTGENSYSGTAEDVIGTAEGYSAGNALNWQYQLNLTIDGSSWKIHFDDWMYLQPDQVLLNTARMSKFGFQVGEVIISFAKNTTVEEGI